MEGVDETSLWRRRFSQEVLAIYLSVVDGGRMSGYFFWSEFKLKLGYIEDIEKPREQVKAKNDEIRLLKSMIEEVEEARKTAETKNEM